MRYTSVYVVAVVSGINKFIGLYCKRALSKRRYSAKETYNLIDPTDHSHPIRANVLQKHMSQKYYKSV